MEEEKEELIKKYEDKNITFFLNQFNSSISTLEKKYEINYKGSENVKNGK